MVILALIFTGLCFGSFINALVWRIHEQTKLGQRVRGKGQSKKHQLNSQHLTYNPGALSILKGRSMCPHCHHPLEVRDLIPVISWLSLKGKCRYCHKPIAIQYPLIELLTASAFLLSYAWWPLNYSLAGTTLFGVWLCALVLLIALAVYDLKWMILPDRLVFPLIGISAVFAAVKLIGFDSLSGVDLLALVSSVTIASGLFYILYIVSKGEWIGGGDVKLGVALGLLLARPDASLLMIFLASLIGSVIAIPLLIQGKSTKLKLPFGPLLIVATILVFWWNEPIIHWYTTLFLS
jgi:prepilin signal peptidase PulO-like enzyme (type II secretory pathway)